MVNRDLIDKVMFEQKFEGSERKRHFRYLKGEHTGRENNKYKAQSQTHD